jgi:hypothetical protein
MENRFTVDLIHRLDSSPSKTDAVTKSCSFLDGYNLTAKINVGLRDWGSGLGPCGVLGRKRPINTAGPCRLCEGSIHSIRSSDLTILIASIFSFERPGSRADGRQSVLLVGLSSIGEPCRSLPDLWPIIS